MADQIKDGGPAFPDGATNEWGYAERGGMRLRDYFAAKAISGLLADPAVPIGGSASDILAAQAYEIADAMLKVREVNNG